MKKGYFLTISLLIFVVISSFAQITSTGAWYIGVGGNYNSTWILNQNTYGEPKLNDELTLNLAGNLNIGFDYNEHWGFKMELAYSQLGEKYKGTQYGEPANRTIQLNYFLLPVLLKYRVGSEKVKFYIMAGPQLGLLLSAKQVYQRNGVNAPVYNSDKGTIDVSQSDIMARNNREAGSARVDIGIELTPSRHFMMDIGLSSSYFITDLNRTSWRFSDVQNTYKISHNFYAGLNLGFNYRF